MMGYRMRMLAAAAALALAASALSRAQDEPDGRGGRTLAEDGRIGKVIDVQGTVSVKPLTQRRWTPVTGSAILQPGDWLRTDARGANAVAVRLVNGTRLTLGPGGLVELAAPQQIQLHSGTIKIVTDPTSPVQLLGAQGAPVAIAGTAIYRRDRPDQPLVPIDPDQPPVWLAGFEGTTAQDSIGSLVANIDGRNVPLTVGYHKVSVDIRDQIARTVIEESFVNHTPARLEGVFYFPLPQDASISGFGMWIGEELVEADVVEKQRAREIYETILRERRDPGLLEWTGGNLFKARVFPIEARSEKRITITYTQVLPLRTNRYRYSYALQSELLKQHPLRELAIDVTISSVLPLGAVACPTHGARIQHTDHAARVEFTAQEYTPDRDFEVVVQIASGQPDTALIPHRRGDDGYFMCLLTPPVSDGGWQRETLADGEPLRLLILADTSGSMNSASRENQQQFVAALLSALTPEDRVNVAVCDVDCQWAFAEPQAADAENVAAARQLLADRVSLGWTDLDKAFRSALDQAMPQTQILYIGDGVVTRGDADPVAFGKRLQRMAEGQSAVFHAASTSSSFEPLVLKTIASLGGGSLWQISGQRTPQQVALDLLAELTQPVIKDLQVEFRGIRAARVYPPRLPNLPAGTQQILLGRYLPEDADQTGEVVVTGSFGGKPVRFSGPVLLKDAEQGNSFIPRLWARMHLDALLDQGASPAIKDEIIGLSEEYHIITPYTSLLVLESDADRERFKVKRRFQMRDGEKFFGQGGDQADVELIQQQMRRAGAWRLGLRRQVLSEWMRLGRDVPIEPVEQQAWALGGESYGGPGPDGSVYGNFLDFSGGMSGADDAFYLAGDRWGRTRVLNEFAEFDGDAFGDLDQELSSERREDDGGLIDGLDQQIAGEDLLDLVELDLAEEAFASSTPTPVAEPMAPLASRTYDLRSSAAAYPENELSAFNMPMGGAWFKARAPRKPYSTFGLESSPYRTGVQDASWLISLFPQLPLPPDEPKPPKERWPAEARQLAEGLLRNEPLAALTGGLVIQQRVESFEPRWDQLTGRSHTLALVSPSAWLVRTESDGGRTDVQWCDTEQRAIASVDFLLGRKRQAAPRDRSRAPWGLPSYFQQSLEMTYPSYKARVEPQGENASLLILQAPAPQRFEFRYHIDTQRGVVLRMEIHQDGKLTHATRCEDFVRAAGAWWPRHLESLNADGQRTSLTTLEFAEVDPGEFSRRMQKQLALRDRLQMLTEPLPSVSQAKQDLADGKTSFEDRMVLAMHFATSGDWVRVNQHFAEAEKLAAGKSGMRWVRYSLLNQSRQREPLRGLLMAEARRLAKDAGRNLFLAEHIVHQASGVLEANENLALLDELRPLYDAQSEHLQAPQRRDRARVGYLQQTGQADQALELLRQLCESLPHDVSIQQQYARGLFDRGEYDAAYAWLQRVITPEARWLPDEEESLRVTYTDLLWQQGRFPDLVEYLDGWVRQAPETQSAYARYLSSLVRTHQEARADELVDKWLDEGRQPDRLSPAVASRLEAAISFAIGQGHDLYHQRIDERWHQALAETAEFLAAHPSHAHLADRIMGDWRFTSTDACRQVRRRIRVRLVQDLQRLPAERLSSLVSWVLPNDPAVEQPQWRKLAEGIERRWAAEQDPLIKNLLASPLLQVLSSRLTAEEHLKFLRRQLAEGPPAHRADFALQLFNTLLAQAWSEELEDEAFSLLPELSDAEDPAERLRTQVAALYRLSDAMVQARNAALMAQVEHPEKLTRTELRARQQANLRTAREQFADRLRASSAGLPEQLAPWAEIEVLHLDVLLGRDLDKVREACWERLGARPQPIPDTDPIAAELAQLLRHRRLVTVAYLATRRSAAPADAQRLLAYLDRGLDTAGDDGQRFGWQLFKYQLLIALDRPQELEQALSTWIKPQDADNYWRRSLAYVQAEQARLREAIALLEQVQAADELLPADYRALAGWYQATGDRERHETALIAAFKATEEWQLSNWLHGQLRPWQQPANEIPEELNPDVLRVFAALFSKSAQPQNYLQQLRGFYRSTHDFRLLAGLADAVIGHTAGKVYPFLQGMQQVLDEVRDEATADSLVERIATVRQRDTTVVDQRALDLLELLVERRGAEILNQPGPHVERALAAMQRAFRREWSAGEPRLAADFLSGLGRISQKPLADEQLRQLESLHQSAQPGLAAPKKTAAGQGPSPGPRLAAGAIDRLHIGHALARAYWSYERHQDAIDLLENSLAEFRTAGEGVLSVDANGPLDTFLSYLASRGHFARGERVLLEEMEHSVHQQQTHWLRERLYQLYDEAIGNGAEVTLGSGADLFQAVSRQLQQDLQTPDQNHRYQLIIRLCGIYRTAHSKSLTNVLDDLRRFAFQRLPEVLAVQANNYQSIVSQAANTLEQIGGPRQGLEFLIERIEGEPRWFRLNNQDGWSQHSYQLAYWRQRVDKELGDLAPRLLKIVVAELKEDLRTEQSRNRSMYHRQHGGHFWAERTDDFARAAEEVHAERDDSGAAVSYIADYLFWGLDRCDRAIEMLFDAHRREILAEDGQSKLVHFLHLRARYGESIPILEPLIVTRPETMQYRTWLMHAYSRVGRRDDLLKLLTQTDEYFHQEGRWQEHAMAALAASCLENRLFEQSVAYYEEVISLHQRTQPRRGIGNGTLSAYYTSQATAYAGLNKTAQAVDAACGAIVSWGPHIEQRTQALSSLEQVIRGAADLDRYVADLDRQTAESGADNPLVRKALGKVYLERGQLAMAAEQLRAACQLQPNDAQTHQKLVECFDRQDDAQGAIGQLIQSLELSRRSIQLYQDLGQRYDKLQRPEDAERAYTSIVEALPNESEGHTLLAEIRQQQDRWAEAAEHWQQVARIRELEPTGLLRLAAARIQLQRWSEAEATIRQLRARPWPDRFSNVDNEVRELERQIEQGQQKN